VAREAYQAPERRDLQIVVLVVALLTVFGLRSSGLEDFGLLELVPVLLAAWWFGRRPALQVAVAGSVLLVGANVITSDMSWEALVPRIGLLLVTAEMMGRLVDDRNRHLDQLRRLIPLQNALAPVTPPELPLLDIATRYVPATSSVGGDFYLITEGHNNSTVIVIADVVGKGMEAAKRATFVRATLSASAAYSQDPAHLLRVANAELIRQYGVSAQFITMLCAVIGPDGSLAWCTAGHPPPVRLADGSGVGAPATSFPLGIAPELERLDVWRGPLPEGGIVLYTDGLTDARPPGGTFEPFGHHRVGMFLRELDHPTPEQAVQRLTEAAQRFAGGVLNDDLCLVAVRSRLAKRVTADGRERAADLPGEAPQPATPQPVR
jgi:hypothetical protein